MGSAFAADGPRRRSPGRRRARPQRRGLDHRSRRGARGSRLRDLLRRGRNARARRRVGKGARRRQAHLLRKASSPDRRAGAGLAAGGAQARREARRGRGQGPSSRAAEACRADAGRRARAHRGIQARVRLVGVRRQRAALPRPSWNYRAGGGGIILDMYPHWRYVIESIVGRIVRVASSAWIATPERIDERGERYDVAVEDSTATLVELEGGAFGTIMSSWATRVRRDDLLTLQVDGTKGSAVAGLHRCHVQSMAQTPAIAHFSVMKDIGADYRGGWIEAPPLASYCNPYRV